MARKSKRIARSKNTMSKKKLRTKNKTTRTKKRTSSKRTKKLHSSKRKTTHRKKMRNMEGGGNRNKKGGYKFTCDISERPELREDFIDIGEIGLEMQLFRFKKEIERIFGEHYYDKYFKDRSLQFLYEIKQDKKRDYVPGFEGTKNKLERDIIIYLQQAITIMLGLILGSGTDRTDILVLQTGNKIEKSKTVGTDLYDFYPNPDYEYNRYRPDQQQMLKGLNKKELAACIYGLYDADTPPLPPRKMKSTF